MMKTLMSTVLVAGLSLLVTACAACADDAADEAAIRELWTSYETHAVANDGETWLTLWDPEGIQMPPGAPMRDYATLVEWAQNWGPEMATDAMEITPHEIVILGDTAYSMGTYWFDFPTEDDGQGRFEGKFMTILKRQDDGSWKLFRDIFNSSTQ
jgi:ketosteroid isomerase-like protein